MPTLPLLEAFEAEMIERLRTEATDSVLGGLLISFSNSVQVAGPHACLAATLEDELDRLMRLYVDPPTGPTRPPRVGGWRLRGCNRNWNTLLFSMVALLELGLGRKVWSGRGDIRSVGRGVGLSAYKLVGVAGLFIALTAQVVVPHFGESLMLGVKDGKLHILAAYKVSAPLLYAYAVIPVVEPMCLPGPRTVPVSPSSATRKLPVSVSRTPDRHNVFSPSSNSSTPLSVSVVVCSQTSAIAAESHMHSTLASYGTWRGYSIEHRRATISCTLEAAHRTVK